MYKKKAAELIPLKIDPDAEPSDLDGRIGTVRIFAANAREVAVAFHNDGIVLQRGEPKRLAVRNVICGCLKLVPDGDFVAEMASRIVADELFKVAIRVGIRKTGKPREDRKILNRAYPEIAERKIIPLHDALRRPVRRRAFLRCRRRAGCRVSGFARLL